MMEQRKAGGEAAEERSRKTINKIILAFSWRSLNGTVVQLLPIIKTGTVY